MPPKAKPSRARTVRKPAPSAKTLAIRAKKKVASHNGFHLGRLALFAGIAAAAAASAMAFMPESISGEMKKQVKAKGKAARASVADAEKIMKQAIEAARSYASNALH